MYIQTKNIEIERKFLLKNENWRSLISQSIQIKQGYPDFGPRVRIQNKDSVITFKKFINPTKSHEWEYKIPIQDAEEILLLSALKIQKTRHLVDIDDFTFEVDEFHGDNTGLIVAEIELQTEEAQFPRPDWLGQEVTEDMRYRNKNLAQKPYSTWE